MESPQLEFVCELKVLITTPMIVGETAHGVRRVVPIAGGSFEGPKMKGEIVNGGADWQIVRKDGVAELEAYYTIKTDDGTYNYIYQKCRTKSGFARNCCQNWTRRTGYSK